MSFDKVSISVGSTLDQYCLGFLNFFTQVPQRQEERRFSCWQFLDCTKLTFNSSRRHKRSLYGQSTTSLRFAVCTRFTITRDQRLKKLRSSRTLPE